MFSRAEFIRIQAMTGREFTIDAACNDDGSNSHCSVYASPKQSFFKHNITGEHIWVNAPFEQAKQWINHYKRCKANSPFDTSAVFVLPKTSNYDKIIQGMSLLCEYPKGTQLFTIPTKEGGREYI
ncbi:hypothetical protein Vretifemale_8476, partial [Volvox reticuliferus]